MRKTVITKTGKQTAYAKIVPLPTPIPVQWELEPCLDLINSRWSDHLGTGRFFDRLAEPAWRRWFLKRWNYKVDNPDDAAAVARLARLRTFLRRALELYISGRQLPPSIRLELESEINRAPVRLQVTRGNAGIRLSMRRSGDPWRIVMAEITTSAVRLLSDRRNVKVCANPHCSWMFVDESRPGTRRWCDASVCGSLHNVRRFRAAHAV
jgi:predicted RNA-binding Zn ribbon-like protein